MALPDRFLEPKVPATTADVGKMPITDRVEYVVRQAAARLPASAGRELLTLIEPKSLAIVVGVLTVWAGAQFFGVGEIADVVLLIGGYAMLGAVALEAARLIYQCGMLTSHAKDKGDLDRAGAMLAQAVALIGVQATLAILLHKPGNVMKQQFFASPDNPNPFSWETFGDLPRNKRWGYKPTNVGVTTLDAGVGGTDVYTGDIEYSLKGRDLDQRLALAHEQVHQFLTPKLRVLRRLRTFTRAQGYNRSYVLRYLEEALAETYAQLRVKGFTKANLIEGVRFPIGDGYMLAVGDIKGEVRQVFLGPITVGGMTYQVWAAPRSSAPKVVRR